MSRKEYFAYGSNLNFDQMVYRCPEATAVGIAKLNGYELAFRRGYLTILPKEDASVEGLIWSITDHDESQLDCYEGYPTFYDKETVTVMDAIQQSLTWRQFLSVLERKGYEVCMGRKYPVLRPPGKERFVRFKTLGKRYTPEAIQTRILYPQSYHPYVENPPTIKHGRLHRGKKPHRKLTGLRALYYRYLYELGALPRKPRRPSYAVRQDAYKLDQRIRQMEFLSKHNIDTLEQLETHRKALQTEIGQLQTKRKQLPKTDDVQSQHESVNTALKQLRQEERLCRKIAEHSIEVQQHLTEARRDRAEQQKQEQERARDRRPNIDLTL